MPGIPVFIQGKPGENPVNKIRQDAVYPVKQGKYRPKGNGGWCQDDQTLQKVFEKFPGNDLEFHNQWFVFKNNQTFGGVHV